MRTKWDLFDKACRLLATGHPQALLDWITRNEDFSFEFVKIEDSRVVSMFGEISRTADMIFETRLRNLLKQYWYLIWEFESTSRGTNKVRTSLNTTSQFFLHPKDARAASALKKSKTKSKSKALKSYVLSDKDYLLELPDGAKIMNCIFYLTGKPGVIEIDSSISGKGLCFKPLISIMQDVFANELMEFIKIDEENRYGLISLYPLTKEGNSSKNRDFVHDWIQNLVQLTEYERELLISILIVYSELTDTRKLWEAKLGEIDMKKISLAEKWAKDIRKGGFDDGKLQGRKKGREEGQKQGLKQGLKQGREEGIEVGREVGIEETLRETLLRTIAKRFDKKSTQEFVERCQKEKSAETLRIWFDEAIIADSWESFLKAIKRV